MSHHHPRKTYRGALGTVALACAAAAQGQDTPKISGIQEIVVTAQKRSQSASTTPLALSVVGGDDLRDAGALNAKALSDLAPNVTIGGGNRSSTEVSIRGIASSNNTEVGDPAASFNIDGQYIARSQGAGASFFDLERVEVLRGPQGTLYGRNSTAGAINVITRKPENRFEASAHGEIGNYAMRRFEGMINQPLSSALALRGVLSATKRDGYIDSAHAPQNAFNRDRSDADNLSGRVHGLLKLPNQASLLLTLDASRDHGAGQGSVPYTRLADNPRGNEGRRQNPSVGGAIDNAGHAATAELKLPTALGEFTALASRRYSKRDERLSFGTPPFRPLTAPISGRTRWRCDWPRPARARCNGWPASSSSTNWGRASTSRFRSHPAAAHRRPLAAATTTSCRIACRHAPRQRSGRPPTRCNRDFASRRACATPPTTSHARAGPSSLRPAR
jgi:iron complex outermembrane receptor protein